MHARQEDLRRKGSRHGGRAQGHGGSRGQVRGRLRGGFQDVPGHSRVQGCSHPAAQRRHRTPHPRQQERQGQARLPREGPQREIRRGQDPRGDRQAEPGRRRGGHQRQGRLRG